VSTDDEGGFLLEIYADYLQFERGLAARTRDAYVRDCTAFAAFARDRDVRSPARADYALLRAWIQTLAESGLAASTLARKISSLRSYFGFLLEEGVIEEDPTDRLERPRGGRSLPEVLSVEEVERILEAVRPEDDFAHRDLAMLEVLYGAGVRVSELAGLRVRDVFDEERLVRVRGKGDRERIVPMGRRAVDSVNRYLRELRPRLDRGESDGVLFLNQHGRPLTRMGIWKILRKYVERAGLEKRVTPHTFRHTFATHLLKGGADLAVVQDLLGHADVSTTQIYTHVDRSYLQEVHRSFHPRG
jgi:integrase/recombinase XerD